MWEEHPAEMGPVLARHEEIIAAAASDAGGTLVRPRGEGDSTFCVFGRASDAVAAATEMQLRLRGERFGVPLAVRAAVHTGEADLRLGDYYGPAVNRCARLRAIAHGGQTLVSLTTEELVRDAVPPDVHLQPLGAFRLKDLTRIENVFQLNHPALPAEFPPLRSLDALPNNLPLQLTSFVGRDDEVATVLDLLRGARLVTLNGAGGCGKTRLALHAAAEVMDDYPDGVWVVDLAPLTDPDKVMPVLASAIGVREERGRPLLEVCAGAISDRRVLIVLDNCEHLLEVAAGVASDLLLRCPELRILATAREPLGIAGETTWRVPSLSLPDASAPLTLDALADSEAARLFLYRARAVAPDLRIEDRDAAAIAQICRRLDGIALALELAAARADVLSPEQIASRLDDRFRLLTGGSRTALERQQTLRAALDWSYGLLAEPARALFARLSVFSGGFTLEAAEDVCGFGAVPAADVLDLVSDLVRKSLVVLDRPAGRAARYRLLETMRQYARERLLASDEGPQVRERHAAWCVALAEAAEPDLYNSHQIERLRMLDEELENIRGALDWMIGSGAADPALRIVGGISVFWQARGHWTEARRWAARTLELPGGAPAARAPVVMMAARLAALQGDVGEAEESLELGRAEADASGDAKLIARAALVAGIVTYQLADREAARPSFEEGVRLIAEVQDEQWLPAALNSTAIMSQELQGSLEGYAAALAAAERNGDLRLQCMISNNLAFIWRLQGYLGRAKEMLDRTLELARDLGDKNTVAGTLQQLATISWFRDDRAEMDRLFGEIEEILIELGGSRSQVWRTWMRATRLASDDDLTAASKVYAEAMREAERAGDRPLGALMAFFIGISDLGADAPTARRSLEVARDGLEALGDTEFAQSIDLVIGWLDIEDGAFEEARRRIVEGLEGAVRWESRIEVADAVACCAAFALLQGDSTNAATFFGASDGLLAEIGITVRPMLRSRVVRYQARLREACASQHELDAAWKLGRAMDWTQATEAALAWLRAWSAGAPAGAP